MITRNRFRPGHVVTFAIAAMMSCLTVFQSTVSIRMVQTAPLNTARAGFGLTSAQSSTLPPFEQSRVLLGIFSLLGNEREFVQRQRIRDTYLSYFQWKANTLNSTTTVNNSESEHFVCSLHELKKQPVLHSSSNKCRIVYTFVVGGHARNNTNERQELLLHNHEKMTTDAPSISLPPHHRQELKAKNQDVTLLNIRENMNSGKSPTWIRYASSLTEQRPELNIDYIAKMDSDTFLDPGRFWNGLQTQLEAIIQKSNKSRNQEDATKKPVMIYGGRYQRGFFNTGYMYLLSKPLANYVSDCTISGHCSKYSKSIAEQHSPRPGETNSRVEDMEMGLFVKSAQIRNKATVARIGIVPPQAFPNIGREEWKIRWAYVQYMTKLQHDKATNTCPTQEYLMTVHMQQFQTYYTMQQFLKDCPC